MKSTDCEYYIDQKDCNNEIVINFCNHPCNPSGFEGNCNAEDCPHKDHTVIEFPNNT